MSTLRTRLQGILDDYVAQGIVGVSLALRAPGEEDVLIASGLADRTRQEPLTPDHLFRIASCTKTFVAACLLQLAQEGRLDLDEPITRWFPDLPKAERLPVRILVNHRGGLPEFENHMPMISDRVWAPQEIVDFAFEVTEQGEPWGTMQYNNTGYILAGMIVAKETGGSLSQALRSRLFEPLGLNDTWVGTDEPYPGDRLARGYFHKEDQDGQWDIAGAGEPVDGCWDSTDWFPLSGANAAGDIIATPRDLMHWIDSLFAGKVLDDARLHEMASNLKEASFPGAPITANGHGILVSTIDGLEIKGHIGQLPGHTTCTGHHEASGASATLCQNSGAGDFESFYLTGIHAPFAACFRAAGAALAPVMVVQDDDA